MPVSKRSFLERQRRWLKHAYLRVMRTKAPPHTIAMGVACGVFGGFLPALPPIPLQSAVALALAFILRGSKVPAVIATFISNPLNWVFFYWLQFKVGKHFVPFHVHFHPREMSFQDYLNVGWNGLIILLIGGVVLGLPSAVAAYFIAKPSIVAWRKRRTLRMLRKKTTL